MWPRVAKMGALLAVSSLAVGVGVEVDAAPEPEAELDSEAVGSTAVLGTAILRQANSSAMHRSSRTKNSKKSSLNIVVASLPKASSCGVVGLAWLE